MHPNVYFSPLAACLALGLSTPAKAADPMPLQTATFAAVSSAFDIASSQQVNGARSVQPDSLKVQSVRVDAKKMRHIRLEQTYAGFRVHGGYAIVHAPVSLKSLKANADVDMDGTVYQGLSAELGQPAADFVKNAGSALEGFKAGFKGKTLSQARVSPIVYIDDANKAHWAYEVSVLVTHHDRIPERARAILDAATQKPLLQWDDIKTAAAAAEGIGSGGNTKTGEVRYGVDLPALSITRDAESGQCYMENTDVKLVDMHSQWLTGGTAMQFICKHSSEEGSNTYWTGYEGDGYDSVNGAFSPSNDGLYAGNVIKSIYKEWFDLEALTTDDGQGNQVPMQLVMRVHYGDGYENAFWDGEQMTFGDGQSMMYPLVSLGVAAHEVSHGFTEQNSGLMYYGQSGGMNESFSDMAAMAAEYYSVGASTWQIGAEIMKEDSGYEALRFMDYPSRDGMSIDSADDYYAGLDVHYSSGVYNRMFYLLSNTEGWNTRKTFEVMVKANMDYWTPYTRFSDGGCGVLKAARDLGYSLDDVRDAMAEVAVKPVRCHL